MNAVQLLGAVVPLLVVLVGYLTYRSTRGNSFIDQLQEQEGETRRRLEKVEVALNLQADYIGVLRKHIVDGAGPPPPPYPEGLRV